MKKLKEILAERAKLKRIEDVPVKGIGTVQIRRVDAEEAIEFDDGFEAIAACVIEDGTPAFASAAAARAADWAVVRALLEAYQSVNSLSAIVEEDAKK